VRNDTGVCEGGQISIHYDPMIAKLCTWAEDRTAAIDAMAHALDDFDLEGIGHNLPFLSAVMRHPRFRNGRLTTAFIAEEFSGGFAGVEADAEEAATLAAVAVFIHLKVQGRNAMISGALANHLRHVGNDWVVSFEGHEFPVAGEKDGDSATVSFPGGRSIVVVSDWLPGRSHASFQVDGHAIGVKVSISNSAYRLRWRGIDVATHVRTPRVAELARLMPKKQPPDTSKMLLCPMPGVLSSIAVREGEAVEIGQALASVEAMKMENVLRAERKGVVARVAAEAGASLAVDDLIIEFE
jgi:propionyl-CoA carboxylase alpha chain